MSADTIADIDAERALLGAALIDENACANISAALSESDFSEPRNRKVFRGIVAVADDKRKVDKYSVKEAIVRLTRAKADDVMPFLDELENAGFVSSESTETCIGIIRGKATLRLLAEVGHRIAVAALNPGAEADKVASIAQEEVRSVLDRNASNSMVDHKAAWIELEKGIFNGKWLEGGITSPWKEIDRVVGGFKPGELIAWAAAPKVGKSGSVLTLASHVAKYHGPVAYFSIEMSAEASRLRQVSHFSGISTRRLRNRQFNDNEDAEEIRRAFRQIHEHAPLFFERPTHHMSRIRKTLRECEREYGQLATIIVDHAGCVYDDVSSTSGLNGSQKLEKMYELFRDLAEEYKAPLHLVQHVSREGQKAERPSMAHLRNGGNLEGLAHTIIIPYRPYPKGDAPPGTDEYQYSKEDQQTIGEFIIEAGREGGEGVIPMRYYGERNLWVVDTAKFYAESN